jgi:hypothetical protein
MKNHLASAVMAVLFATPAYAQPPETAVTPKARITVEGATKAPSPTSTPLVVSQTRVLQTPSATVEQTTETIIPISDRPALNPETPIAPEVQAVVASKKHYTTADLANAQLAAVLATPASEPTTTITTTRTTPKSGG